MSAATDSLRNLEKQTPALVAGVLRSRENYEIPRVSGPETHAFLAQVGLASQEIDKRKKLRASKALLEHPARIRDIAFAATSKLIGQCDGAPEWLPHRIAADFESVAKALLFAVSDPALNATWISYKTGVLPWRPLRVDGKLPDLIGITLVQARRRFDEATRDYEREKAAKDIALTKRQEAELVLPEILRRMTGPIPDSAEAIHQALDLDWSDRVALKLTDLKGVSGVPSLWKDWLRKQEMRQPISWKRLWGCCSKRMPGILEFLHEKCRGIAVLVRVDGSVSLMYLDAFRSDQHWKGGLAFGAMIGGKPLGPRISQKVAAKLDLMPSELQEFYQSVHNGWTSLFFGASGPMPVDRVQFLGEEFREIGEFSDLKADFNPDELLMVMRVRDAADAVCLDTGKRKRQGAYPAVYWTPDPKYRKTDANFWDEMNRWLRVHNEGLLPGH